ncbi:MAG: DNA primase, partial [Burkholderiales bacterium]
MIPDSFKQELLHRIDIVDVIERYVPLKKGGANFMACCPFHSEKTPSFTVSPGKQFYHCFGCGAHGNAISFLMEYQGLGYVEAVRDLAESAGMKMPEFEPRARKSDTGPDLYSILERAGVYYRERLKAAPRAVEYLKSRGLTGKIAARFGIGYAPEGWQNLESVFPDYSGKALKDAGLVIEGEGGRRYDRFRDRIMFPILNQRGSVIGFGGRVLGAGRTSGEEDAASSGPKYLNSPETSLFEKGRELYGLAQARQAIRAAGRVIVVEGYMDVVALAQHGIEYTVATLGTATSAAHVQKLLRQTDEVVFCFDGDAAGRKAAWQALEVSLSSLDDSKTVRFLFLPPEHDPDSFVREKGKEAFENGLEAARPLSEFFLEELMGRVDINTYEGRSRLVHEAKPLLKLISARRLQLQLVQMIAAAGHMTADQTAQFTRDLTENRLTAPARGMDRGTQAPELTMVRILLQCLLSKPVLAGELSTGLLDQSSPEARALIAVAEFCRENPNIEGNVVVDHFRATEFRQLLESNQAALLDKKLETEDMEVDFRGALERLRERQGHHRFELLRLKTDRTPEEETEMLGFLRERKPAPASASTDARIA